MAGLDNIALRVVDTPRQDGEPLTLKTRAVALSANINNSFSMNFLDRNGHDLDLATLGYTANSNETTDSKLVAKIREAVLLDTNTENILTASVVNPETGEIKIDVPGGAIQDPGIYRIAVGILKKDDGTPVIDNELLAYVEPNLWNTGGSYSALPKLSDIRMLLRDSDPKENELLQDHDFSLSDICMAAIQVCRLWNDTPPPLPPISSTSMKYPDIWTTGIQTFLFEMAFEHYRRNRFPYNAGGVQIDDKAKDGQYGQIWQLKYQLLRDMIQTRKLIENRRRLYGVVSHWGRWSRWP